MRISPLSIACAIPRVSAFSTSGWSVGSTSVIGLSTLLLRAPARAWEGAWRAPWQVGSPNSRWVFPNHRREIVSGGRPIRRATEVCAMPYRSIRVSWAMEVTGPRWANAAGSPGSDLALRPRRADCPERIIGTHRNDPAMPSIPSGRARGRSAVPRPMLSRGQRCLWSSSPTLLSQSKAWETGGRSSRRDHDASLEKGLDRHTAASLLVALAHLGSASSSFPSRWRLSSRHPFRMPLAEVLERRF
jgi:hypothetical protein